MWCVREGPGGPVAGYFDAVYRGGKRLVVAYVCLVARKEDGGKKLPWTMLQKGYHD